MIYFNQQNLGKVRNVLQFFLKQFFCAICYFCSNKHGTPHIHKEFAQLRQRAWRLGFYYHLSTTSLYHCLPPQWQSCMFEQWTQQSAQRPHALAGIWSRVRHWSEGEHCTVTPPALVVVERETRKEPERSSRKLLANWVNLTIGNCRTLYARRQVSNYTTRGKHGTFR